MNGMNISGRKTITILAVASGGGHWEQLMLMRDVFADSEIHYATPHPELAERFGIQSANMIPDCNRSTPAQNIKCLWDAFRMIVRIRPDVVITTGAAPGLVALVLGRLFGARGIWVDSVANSERLSLSGRLAKPFATVRITQWSHLATPDGPQFHGSVL